MRPPMVIAMRMPLPALAVADPIAPKMPVPIIIAAVIRVAVLRPSVRASDVLDSGFPDCCPEGTSAGVGFLLMFDLQSSVHLHRRAMEQLSPGTPDLCAFTLRLLATSENLRKLFVVKLQA